MGNLIRVAAIFHDDDECNKWLTNHPGYGVIACYGGVAMVARKDDLGRKVNF
jgi:hypothetical protein